MDTNLIFRIIGIVGLCAIIAGLRIKKRSTQNKFYIVGGICLAAYSIFLEDMIFIILQVVYTIAAIWDYFQNRK